MPDMFKTPSFAPRRHWLTAIVLLGLSTLSPAAFAQQGYPQQGYPQQGGQPNPMCPRLEAQLASIDRGGGDPAKAEQIRRFEDAASRQQRELDRVSQQAKRMGCDSSGFFSMFNGQSAECGPLNNQIQQMRGNLDQITASLERLRVGGGNPDRDNQRRSVLLALAQNNCGPQYANQARESGSFLDNLFGNNGGNGGADIAPPPAGELGPRAGTFRTVCARSCDGYYFPISFATVPGRFADDEMTCKNLCPAADATLFTYRNPGEDMHQAVSINGTPYASTPNAFRYRKEFIPTCSCKAAGQTWSEALKNIDNKSAVPNGDIIVTEESAKKMAQPKAAPKSSAAPAATPAAAPAAADPNKPIRSVGPTYLPTVR
ncbi:MULTISPECIES: DUF2865 domain-containing protein [Rhodopseudomonas]|uniref:DUF2865 domain-containing protein n=1 Tax=Rhodopseudomonas palustris TaxID=1076 RepID=A0A0D7DYY5_RHOPL|nr:MULTISPECIES: DUF2865 domain-containing protein [Rhodopseudomonas]KIZ33793.1 hypothetical protein OO17_28035 [Rhodopseudomonas palustris]MDF3813595.1 DUF2865 domain-containing protein [Rhodopseudomonas sp. BAL398]WOK19810.1 DUF2865 domain-containing protein [Rhodopseudomonas sp. BAL398]